MRFVLMLTVAIVAMSYSTAWADERDDVPLHPAFVEGQRGLGAPPERAALGGEEAVGQGAA